MIEMWMIIAAGVAIVFLIAIAILWTRMEASAGDFNSERILSQQNDRGFPVILRQVESPSAKNFNPASKRREELRKELLALISEEADSIRKILGVNTESGARPNAELTTQTEAASPDMQSWNAAREPGYDTLHDGCRQYNHALRNQEARVKFRQLYEPLVISVANAVDRVRDDRIKPVFKTAAEGNFQAIKSPDGTYAIFPKFGLIVQESSYGPGAVGEVFECPNFSAQHSYEDFTVIRPAVFIAQDDDEWRLTNPGVLKLGNGHET